MRRVIVALFAVVGAAAAARAQDPPAPPPPVIVTMGEAIVRRVPDVAYVTLAVEARARSPRDAQRQNADAMTAVQKRLADAGIPKDAIRTLGYDIQQEFDVVENGRRVPRDFVARNSIQVTVDHIERTGEIIDATVQGGATSVSGVGFDLKNRDAAEREALRLAVADARARADAAAAGAGRSVDRILRIEEGGRASPPRPMAVMSRAAQADTPVAPGLLEIRANVTLTVSMK
jgi:uncharacterized protein YggE